MENEITEIKTPSLSIITAKQRLEQKRGIKGIILGKSGIGKTSLLLSLPEESTLFIDLEAGDLAVAEWQGNALRPTTWQECRDLACFIGGANPSFRNNQCYSQAHFEKVQERYGDLTQLDKYDTIFIDSITVASRFCKQWCEGQPQSFTEERTGKPSKLNLMAVYGLLGKEMISWVTHLQHARQKNIWLVAILDEKLDEYNKSVFSMQIDGATTALALPGIVDQIITLAEVREHSSGRAFITHTINPYGYPAKDRSGRLEMYEEGDLQKLMDKINNKGTI